MVVAGGRLARGGWAVVLTAAALALALAWPFAHDDAFITFRYADRWLSGHGLTWTSGPPVEGYTHPLWLLQLTALGALGLPLPAAGRVLGVAWLVALAVTWRAARAHPLVLAVLLAVPAVAQWAVSGLETVGFAALAVMTAALVERLAARPGDVSTGLLLGAAVGAATLTRPEGAGLAVAAGLWLLARRDLRALGPTVVSGSLLVGALMLFRWTTYGSLLSTSSSAKLGDLTPAFHLGSFLAYVRTSAPTLMYGLVPVALALAFGARSRMLRPAWLAAPLVGAAVLAGGDHMPQARFFVPVLALLTFGAGLALQERIREDARPLVHGALGGMVALLLLIAGVVDPARPDPASAVGAPVGRALEDLLPPGTLVACATAGSTPYHAPSLDFLDTLGLNDPTIAQRPITKLRTAWQVRPGHRKGDGAYVLAREPSVIVLGGAEGILGHEVSGWFLTDRELLEDPAFHAAYRPYGLRVDLVGGERLPRGSDPDHRWWRQTGLGPQTRPAALQADAVGAFVLIAWLREGDARVERLRAAAVPLGGLLEGREPTYTPFCADLGGLRATVPCEDGSAR